MKASGVVRGCRGRPALRISARSSCANYRAALAQIGSAQWGDCQYPFGSPRKHTPLNPPVNGGNALPACVTFCL
ncbi:MAG TPA: hypothetical protein PK468_17385, partial [Candidatus Hydrogenedentes bacterium]|nr:hypothetical protein [Candidatus Hydrogenedentota bacterium]